MMPLRYMPGPSSLAAPYADTGVRSPLSSEEGMTV